MPLKQGTTKRDDIGAGVTVALILVGFAAGMITKSVNVGFVSMVVGTMIGLGFWLIYTNNQ